MEETYEIKKIPVWPVIKLSFIIFLFIGILIAILYSLLLSGLSFLAGTLSESPFGNDFVFLQRFGLMMIPVIALTYAVFGTIAVTIWVIIYDIAAAIVGGVELTLKPKEFKAAHRLPPEEAAGREIGRAPGEKERTHIPERPIDGF